MQHVRRRLIALCLVWLALAANPAFAATIAQINGTGTGHALADLGFSGTTSLTLTSTANVSASGGNAVIIFVSQTVTGSAPTLSVADSKSNTWNTCRALTNVNGATTQIFYSILANSLTTSDTFTLTSNVSGGIVGGAAAFTNVNASPCDTPADVVTTGSAPGNTNLTTGTLTCTGCAASNELLIGALTVHSGSTGQITPDGTFINFSNNTQNWAWGALLVTATTPITFNPTRAQTSNWSAMINGFLAAPSGGTTTARHKLMLGKVGNDNDLVASNDNQSLMQAVGQ